MTSIFETIIRLSFSASWLIAAVVLVRFFGKKIPKKYICVLWLLVGIRLVFPFHMESPWSLIPNVNEVAVRDIRLFYYNQVFVEKKQPTVVTVGPFQKEVRAGVTYISEEGEPDAGLAAGEREEEGAMKAVQGFLQKNLAPITLMSVLMWIWAAGIVVMFGYFAFSIWYLKRKLSEAVLLEDNIWQSEYVASPFIFGLLQPKIYIPYHMTEEELSHVLVHEKIHLRRKDNWLKALAFGIVCVYWFHLLVWIAYSLLCRDMEMACDELVVSYMDEDTRRKYSLALLTCRSKRTWYHTSPIGFGEVEVRERVLRIKQYQEPSEGLVMLAVVLCIGTALCFWTNVKPQYPVSGNLSSWEDADMEPEPKETRKVYKNGDMDGNGIVEYHVWQQAEESPEQDEQVTFYWNEEPIFTYQDNAMIGLHRAEYVDLDKDGQKEIWILLYTDTTDQYGNYKGHPKIFLLKQEQGK